MQRWKASPAAPSAFAPTTTAQLMCAASPNLPFLAANAACASRPDAMRTSVTRRRKSVRTQHADITRDPNLGPWAISDTAAPAARLVARTHSLGLEVFGHCRPSDRAAGRGPGARLARSVESSERVSPEGYADGAPGSGTSRRRPLQGEVFSSGRPSEPLPGARALPPARTSSDVVATARQHDARTPGSDRQRTRPLPHHRVDAGARPVASTPPADRASHDVLGLDIGAARRGSSPTWRSSSASAPHASSG